MSLARRKNIERYRELERVRQQRKRARLRSEVRSIKERAACTDCGESHPACLQFHHRDPSTKLDRINRLMAESKSRDVIMAEIAKCLVLCANCHAKRHWNEQNGIVG